MKNLKNILFAILIIVAVVFVVFFLSTAVDGRNYKHIDSDKYKELVKKDAIIYVGEKESDLVEEVATDFDIRMYHIALSDVKKHDNEVIEVWKKGKLVRSFDFSAFSYDESNSKALEEISINQYADKAKQEGFNLLFVGREGCSYCQMFTEAVNEALKEFNFNIYYIDIAKFEDGDIQKLYDNDDFFANNEWGTPTTMLYKDGVKVDMLNGYVDSSTLLNFLKTNYIKDFLNK